MKVLQCHNYYQQAGGEDRVLADEADLLRSRGHTVVQFTKHNDAVNDISRIRLAWGTIWNSRSAAELKDVIRREKFDVVHFHNTLPLISPAGYYAARSQGVAVVQTLHNYRLTCPSATFFRDGKVCEECLGKRFAMPAVRHKCYRGSRSATLVSATMLAVHKTIGTYARCVDRYIACSQFTKRKLTQAGLPERKIAVKPNFIVNDPGTRSSRGDYAMFLGRLSHEKGVQTLLDAWRLLPAGIHLKLVGNGPLQDIVRAATQGSPNVEWLPGKSDDEVRDLISEAKFLVLPSVNYEGFPKTIVESLSVGIPVVASKLGAMAELIDDRRTGRLFEAGNPAQLAQVVSELYYDDEALAAMRVAARREYEEHYTAERNYDLLMQIYQQAIAERHANLSCDAQELDERLVPATE